ncbi:MULTISPECIES: tRNA lysidine(34) synthetase TilS [Dyella]|uniref:tRNA lysidine(34) synthetase TilS n=1 Tax=Dyella TaxID=231454 RepID=UPI001F104573|nr:MULTISPECIES: tRNA lysidine(34) synthetase TilS [Dyella]
MSKPDPLTATIVAALRDKPEGPLCIGFSGGPDSTALLHALASLPQARARHVRAIHVDHGIHPDSAHWAERARQFCSMLEVPCTVLKVHVQPSGEGLEAAARHARYDAIAQRLSDGEWLVLGHHRDDQAETVLMKLLRGAGPEGLGGMRATRALGNGALWRPLLHTPRAMLREYVARHDLPSIHDPSNDDTRLSRNLLRQQVIPALLTQWPHAIESILHSATLCREATDALKVQWLEAFADIHDASTQSIDAAAWLALPPGLRHPLLDHWLHERGLRAPTSAQRQQIERQARDAAPGTRPLIHWSGVDLYVWKGRLWARRPPLPFDADWSTHWRGEPLTLPDGSQLSRQGLPMPATLTVRFRQGGERIKPMGDAHTRELRDLFQRHAIPPWERPAIPLLFEGDALVAVGDLWLNERGHALLRGDGAIFFWTRGH